MNKDKTMYTEKRKNNLYEKVMLNIKNDSIHKPLNYTNKNKANYDSPFEIPYFNDQYKERIKLKKFEARLDYIMIIFSFICIIGLILISI